MTTIKAVFFNGLNTIARTEPDRHVMLSQVLLEFGVEPSPEKILRAIYVADGQLQSGAPHRASGSEAPEVLIRYQEMILSELGVKFPRNAVLQILSKVSQLTREATYVLYDDVLPTLDALRERGLILASITNLGKNVNRIVHQLGLEPYLEFVVSPSEVGANKPEPRIFLAALERAGVDASEAIYVGDQYEVDVVGARRVGIKPILIDRYDLFPEVSDCPRIRTLPELVKYV